MRVHCGACRGLSAWRGLHAFLPEAVLLVSASVVHSSWCPWLQSAQREATAAGAGPRTPPQDEDAQDQHAQVGILSSAACCVCRGLLRDLAQHASSPCMTCQLFADMRSRHSLVHV